MARKKRKIRADTGNGLIDLNNLSRRLRGSVSAETLTLADAMQVPAFDACVNLICDMAAVLPVRLYENVNGIVNEITDDPRLNLLNKETGDMLNPLELKRAAVFDYLTVGNSYIFLEKNGNKINSLRYVKAENVSVMINSDPIFKEAYISVNGRRYNNWDFVISARKTKNGVTGIGVLQDKCQILAASYNTLLFENRLIASGGNKRGFLQAENRVLDPILEKIKQGWRKLYQGSNDVVVLNAGVKFHEISETSVELQLDERKKTNNMSIHEAFGVSYNIFGDSVSDDDLQQTIQTAIMPAVMALQAAINKAMLLESEKPTMFFEFDLNELNKGNLLKRCQAYKIALEGGYMTTDEVRELENLQPLGLNWVRMKLSDVFYNPETKEIYTPNTNSFADLEGGGQSNGNEG